MTIYRRKPIEVDVFFFGVQSLPQWFIDATHTGESHDDGSGREFVSFRLKNSKRILKLTGGDAIVRYGERIWSCERDSFHLLYEFPPPTEITEDQSVSTVVSTAVAAMVAGAAGTSLCIAFGYWLGAGWGWFLMAVMILLMGIMGYFAPVARDKK